MRRRDFLTCAAALALCDPTRIAFAAPLAPDQTLAAQSRLSFRLLERLSAARERGANLVISPASLAAVLSLIDLGADANLHTSLYRVLGFEDGNAVATLESLRVLVGNILRDNSGPLLAANALVIDANTRPIEATLAKMRAAGAEITVDDVTDLSVVRRINDWASMRTKGHIPVILDGPPEKGALALNALYFKDDWERQFDKSATRPGAFHGLNRIAEVPMMQQKASYSFRREGRFVAVDLSYVHKRYALVALTTTDRPAAAGEFASVAHWLDGKSFSTGRARLELPRFAVTEQADLFSPLKTMGLAESLASPTAFEGLAAAPLTITGILQRTFLKLGEEGTEAAAVTGAVFATRAMPVEEMAIVIDKPFLFALRDRDTGLILMSGYMGKPASGPVA
jgi:serine protease inhibitor